MPHSRMQDYVNVDYGKIMSIVGLVGPPGEGRLIAEARYVKSLETNYGDVAFVVDEEYQGLGIASFLFKTLLRVAQERGLAGFTADVLATNKGMMKVFERGGLPVKAGLEGGAYHLTIPFQDER